MYREQEGMSFPIFALFGTDWARGVAHANRAALETERGPGAPIHRRWIGRRSKVAVERVEGRMPAANVWRDGMGNTPVLHR